jgi:plasmid stabilization system protein ParE
MRAFIARDKPSAARKQVTTILAAVAGLEHFPDSGRSGRKAGTRELVIGKTPYLAVYKRHKDKIEILRLLHGWQAWPH